MNDCVGIANYKHDSHAKQHLEVDYPSQDVLLCITLTLTSRNIATSTMYYSMSLFRGSYTRKTTPTVCTVDQPPKAQWSIHDAPESEPVIIYLNLLSSHLTK